MELLTEEFSADFSFPICVAILVLVFETLVCVTELCPPNEEHGGFYTLQVIYQIARDHNFSHHCCLSPERWNERKASRWKRVSKQAGSAQYRYICIRIINKIKKKWYSRLYAEVNHFLEENLLRKSAAWRPYTRTVVNYYFVYQGVRFVLRITLFGCALLAFS